VVLRQITRRSNGRTRASSQCENVSPASGIATQGAQASRWRGGRWRAGLVGLFDSTNTGRDGYTKRNVDA
jgi:hypothetical protein